MTKRLIDVDDDALGAARAELGTTTIKDTVNEALKRSSADRKKRIADSLSLLATAELDGRDDGWR
ncbi:MAG: hypothetical protein R2754_11560 [Microthrixaceae bacterium]